MTNYNIVLKQDQAHQWHMLYNGQDYGPGHYPTLSVLENDTGAFSFTICQGSNFANDPISVVPGHNKPPHSGVGNGQITVTSHSNTGLAFTDSNNQHGHNQLNYVLYFSDGTTLDPIIDNGGCCTFSSFLSAPAPLTGSQVSILLLVAFLAGMLAMVAVRAMRKGA